MKIKVVKVKAKDLKAGDLFSTANQTYWDQVNENLLETVGEKVYVRTIQECPKNQENEDIYKLEVV